MMRDDLIMHLLKERRPDENILVVMWTEEDVRTQADNMGLELDEGEVDCVIDHL